MQDRGQGSSPVVADRDAAAPGARRHWLGVGVLVAAVGAVVVLLTSVSTLVARAGRPDPMTPYVAPQYWLGYSDGFVRRGFPGAVLRVLSGGQPPSYELVKAAAVGLTAASLLAVVVLALLLARRTGDRLAAAAVVVAMMASPLSIAHLARDVGRTDALGVVVLVALVALPWRRLPPVAVVVSVALLTSAAVASEEFLVAFVLPPAVLAVRSALAGRRFPAAWTAAAVLPSLLVALLSAVRAAPPDALRRADAEARSAGVPATVPLAGGPQDHDAVSRLGYSLWENVTAYYATTTPVRVLVTTLIWASAYLLLVGLVWLLLGRSVRDRGFVLVTSGMGLVAVALSVIGIDYRRWWALAAVSALCLILLRRRERPGRRERISRGTVVGLVVLTVSGLLLRSMPVYPLDASHLDRLLNLPW